MLKKKDTQLSTTYYQLYKYMQQKNTKAQDSKILTLLIYGLWNYVTDL